MAKESLNNSYKLLVDELDKILNSQEIVPQFNNQNVVLQLLKSIKICEYLEDKLEIPQSQRKSFSFLEIVSKYYAIGNIHVDSYYFIDDSTLNDDINYLAIYIKNLLKKDYINLTPRLQENTKATSTHDVHTGTLEHKNENKTSNATSDKKTNKNNKNIHANELNDNDNYDYASLGNNQDPYANMGLFGRMMGNTSYYGQAGGFAPEEQMASTAANLRLQNDIASGKIYMFSTKPKFIPWMKIAAGVFLILVALFTLIQAAMWSVGNNLLISSQLFVCMYDKIFSQHVSIKATTIDVAGISISTKSNAWNISNSGFSSMIWIYSLIYIAIFCWEAYLELKPVKNINEKYRFHWGWLLFIIVWSFFLWFGFYTYDGHFPPQLSYAVFAFWAQFKIYATTHISFYTGLFAVQIIYILLISFILIFCILAMIFNPKKDTAYLNEVFNKYYQQAKEQFVGENGF